MYESSHVVFELSHKSMGSGYLDLDRHQMSDTVIDNIPTRHRNANTNGLTMAILSSDFSISNMRNVRIFAGVSI